MSLTRKMLKGMGLTEEQIDTIIEGHDETISALKEERDGLREKANQSDAYKTERDRLQQQLDAGKNGTDWKAKYDELVAENDAREKQAKVRAAYRGLLQAEKIDGDLIDTVMDATNFDGMQLENDGTLHDAQALSESIRNRWAKFVVTEGQHPTPTPTPPGNQPGKLTRADIYKKDERGRYVMSTEERQKALAENPGLLSPGAD